MGRITSYMAQAASLLLIVLLVGCSGGRSGGYYSNDGPPSGDHSYLDSIPDAIPKIEPLASGPNRPYRVMGQSFVPDTSGAPYRNRGIASWYGKKFHGNPTSNGERYDMYAMSAAHTTLPIPSYARVTRVSNGRSVVVRINDRGPFLHGREIDLSYAAAHRLGIVGPGSAEVIVERIMPEQIRAGSWGQTTASTTPTVYEAPATAPAAPTATAAPVVTMAAIDAAAPSQQTYLQIGAFREQNNAVAFAHRAAGFVPDQVPVEVDQRDANLFRVRVGPYSSREHAQEAMDALYNSLGVMPSFAP